MDKKSRELVMAKLYLKNQDYKMAEKSFDQYLNMNPDDVNAMKSLAQVYEHNKRFDKAFELYERCYLAEPDRAGVLLDICRILLMNEIWLDNVDYRKWLNLAIKAFPSNPIVTNYKAFLNTLPAEHQTTYQNVSTHSVRDADDDPLAKIFDKLLTIEGRLATIEDKMANLSVAPKVAAVPAPAITPAKAVTPAAPAAPSTQTPTPAPISAPAANLTFTPTPAPTSTILPKSVALTTPTFKASPASTQSPKPFSVATPAAASVATTTPAPPLFSALNSTLTQNQPPKPNSVATPTSLFGAPPATTFGGPFSWGNNSFSGGSLFGNTNTPPAPVNPENKENAPFNFFADGMRRLNLDTSWNPQNQTPTKPQLISQPSNKDADNDDGEDGDGYVRTEELPIENTCTMQPIEMKTGEEDEDILFEHRCKLFRFRDKEYKERGLGSIKVLKHRETSKGRLIMRREATGLVCLNCWDLSKIERVRDNQVRWICVDASDGEADATVFLVKFKTPELTDTFIGHLNNLFQDESSTLNTSISKTPAKEGDAKVSDKPDVELVNPKLNQELVDKARKLQLPDLFYHEIKNQGPCSGCDGCEKDS